MATKLFRDVRQGDLLIQRGVVFTASSEAREIFAGLWRVWIQHPANIDCLEYPPDEEIEFLDTIPRATVAAALAELRKEMADAAQNRDDYDATITSIDSGIDMLDATIAKLGLEAQ